MPDDREQEFQQAGQLIERHSAELKKELRLGDLVMSHVMYIAGLQWIGTAGKVGPSHIMYWAPAVLLFFIPSGLVVVHLNREMPLEGGLYQWVKLRFGDLAGFLTALNLWATAVLIIGGRRASEPGVFTPTSWHEAIRLWRWCIGTGSGWSAE